MTVSPRATGASIAEQKRMLALVLNAASPAGRRNLEAMMMTTEFKSTFVDAIYADGFAKGLEMADSRGKPLGLLKFLLNLKLIPSEAHLHMVASCIDEAQLDRWLDRALTATSAEEVFAD